MLSERVIGKTRKVLGRLIPLWLQQPMADTRRVTRPVTQGQYEIAIEPYRGFRTAIEFQKTIEQRDDVRELDELIRSEQPELYGHVHSPQITHRHRIQGVQALLLLWCQRISDGAQAEHLPAAIDNFLAELQQLIQTGKAKVEISAPIAGLSAPDSITEIDLDSSLKLRRLTKQELTELGSHDIYMPSDTDIMSRNLGFVAVITEEASVSLRLDGMGEPFDNRTNARMNETLEVLLSALSVLKEGRVSVVSTQTKLLPSILPGMTSGTSRPHAHPFESMQLNEEEVSRLPRIFSALKATSNPEIRIAATRLRDAERRFSTVDGILDAVIGLETLLNPQDYAELAFRVAINFAFLASPSERRSRYESIRDVQRTRNGIVHGGLSLSSSKGATIPEHAIVAKRSLRDALTRFLTEPELRVAKKLDADFWLDRIIPPTEPV